LHAVTIGKGVGDLEGGVEVFAWAVGDSVEIPIEDEEIDVEVVSPG